MNQGLVLLLGCSELAIVLGVLAYFLLRGRGSWRRLPLPMSGCESGSQRY